MAAIEEGFCRRPVCIALYQVPFTSRPYLCRKVLSAMRYQFGSPSNTETGRLYNVSASLVRQHQQGYLHLDTRSVGFRVAMYWGA